MYLGEFVASPSFVYILTFAKIKAAVRRPAKIISIRASPRNASPRHVARRIRRLTPAIQSEAENRMSTRKTASRGN